MLTGDTQFLVVSWYFWASLIAMIVTSPRSFNYFVSMITSLTQPPASSFASFVTLAVGLLISIAVGHFITSVFSFVFYLRGGYNHFDLHQRVQQRFLQDARMRLSAEPDSRLQRIERFHPLAIEAFLLYHYSNSDFIAWVRRRYAVYFTNMSVTCALILGVVTGLVLDFTVDGWRLIVILSAAVFVAVLNHNSRLTLREVEEGELVLCERVLTRFLDDILQNTPQTLNCPLVHTGGRTDNPVTVQRPIHNDTAT